MRIILAIIALLLACSLAGAEMYQWVDENGVVTFRDTPPPAAKKRKKVKVYADSDFEPAPPPQPAPAPRGDTSAAKPTAQPAPKKERFTGTVELYVTAWCGYCKKAQRYLTDRGIPFVAYDIEKDSGARQRHKELGGRGVPLIIIGSNKVAGFSPESVEYYLNNSR
ncbi:MAG TPA: glutaredoxin domain-containing protein [Geobacteraceae bacterium]